MSVEERRKCWREEARKWRAENKERFQATVRARDKKNQPKLKEYRAKYYQTNKVKALADSKAYVKDHPEINKAAVRRYQAKKRADPEWLAEQAAKAKEWRNKNLERHRANCRANNQKRYETDPVYMIKARLRSRLAKKLKCQKAHKATDTLSLTGCTGEFLGGYLEARFKPGMSWNNVHIDHIVPCDSFDLRDPEQQRLCFYYQNLQPLFAVDNMRKGAKIPVSPTKKGNQHVLHTIA